MLVHDKAHELVRALKNAPEYKELFVCKDKLKQDPGALKMFVDYRRKELEYETLQVAGQNVPENMEESLGKLREIVYLNSYIRDYVQAEARFGAIFGDVQRIIGESLKDITDMYTTISDEEGGNE